MLREKNLIFPGNTVGMAAITWFDWVNIRNMITDRNKTYVTFYFAFLKCELRQNLPFIVKKKYTVGVSKVTFISEKLC